MRVWERNEICEYDYPDDMAKILDYLTSNGHLYVSGLTVEKLYRRFSDDVYCAGWMSVNSKAIIEEFARWLERRYV